MTTAAQTVYQRHRLTVADYHRMGQAGVLSWRTWSVKNNLRAGRWAVDVLYGDAHRSPVQCRIAAETGTKPCHFEIDVR